MQVIDGMMMYHLRPWHVYHRLTWEHLTLRIHGLFATNWAFREPLGWKFLLRFTMEGGFGKGLGNDYFSCLFMLCEIYPGVRCAGILGSFGVGPSAGV